MIKTLADDLLSRVYYPVTAVVSLDADGKAIGVRMFDSQFGTEENCLVKGAQSAAVLCGHPEGSMKLTMEEIRNVRRIAGECAGRNMRVYICGEDLGCIEVDSERFCSYNEKNAI